MSECRTYRGRIAPTPSGQLHIGHARTFHIAHERARSAAGKLVLRIEDLDSARCKDEYSRQMMADLEWLGIRWDEGPDCGGAFEPYVQSLRLEHYLKAWKRLEEAGVIYPSPHSRKDVELALSAPHEGEGEPLFPVELRPVSVCRADAPSGMNWRFRVPDGESVRFVDECAGVQEFVAGKDFGDFLVWRKDGWPSYELAVVVDDAEMQISEVVRGADLLLSTARQLLLYKALGWTAPRFFHCPLVRDAEGRRLAKRSAGLSVAELREEGFSSEKVLALANTRMG